MAGSGFVRASKRDREAVSCNDELRNGKSTDVCVCVVIFRILFVKKIVLVGVVVLVSHVG